MLEEGKTRKKIVNLDNVLRNVFFLSAKLSEKANVLVSKGDVEFVWIENKSRFVVVKKRFAVVVVAKSTGEGLSTELLVT